MIVGGSLTHATLTLTLTTFPDARRTGRPRVVATHSTGTYGPDPSSYPNLVHVGELLSASERVGVHERPEGRVGVRVRAGVRVGVGLDLGLELG